MDPRDYLLSCPFKSPYLVLLLGGPYTNDKAKEIAGG